MTDRDHFAAAALTGFASQPRFNCGSVLTLTAKQCYELADAMLRERAKTNHDAAPAARANAESVAPQPTARGDSDRTDKAAPRPFEGTGDTPKPINGCVSDRSKPITGPDPDSRVWETHTPATHATRGEGSERRECAEPVAWATFHGTAHCVAEPLYRRPQPTLTDAEREALHWFSHYGLPEPKAAALRGLLERLGGAT